MCKLFQINQEVSINFLVYLETLKYSRSDDSHVPPASLCDVGTLQQSFLRTSLHVSQLLDSQALEKKNTKALGLTVLISSPHWLFTNVNWHTVKTWHAAIAVIAVITILCSTPLPSPSGNHPEYHHLQATPNSTAKQRRESVLLWRRSFNVWIICF